MAKVSRRGVSWFRQNSAQKAVSGRLLAFKVPFQSANLTLWKWCKKFTFAVCFYSMKWYIKKVLLSTAFKGKMNFCPLLYGDFLQKSLAVFKYGNLSGADYKITDKTPEFFCLTENFWEDLFEIKKASNLKKFCYFERKRTVWNFFAASTSLHLGSAEISPRQAKGADERTRRRISQ